MPTHNKAPMDTSSLVKLDSRGENFPEYRSAWTLAFKYNGLWPWMTGKNARPLAGMEAQDAWDEEDNRAQVMILSSIHNDFTMAVASCKNAAEAWKYLTERFDRDTSRSSLMMFRAVTSVRYQDGEDLNNHIDEFDQMWTRMATRCAGSSQSMTVSLRTLFENDEAKGAYFMMSLPDSMEPVVDTLIAREMSKFKDIKPRILDIAEAHATSGDTSSTAYLARRTTARQRRLAPGDDNTPREECTWCRKHNLKYIGHVYTNCRELRKFKDKQQSERRVPTKKQKANNADAVELDSDDDDSATEVSAFAAMIAPANPHDRLPSKLNKNNKRPCENVSALTVSIRQRPKHQQPDDKVWLFDTGASRHMSGCVDDFVSISPGRGTITIAGGIKLPIHGIGTVRLRCRLPDGSTKMAELTKVLYSSELCDTRLVSWSFIRNKFTLTGSNDNIYVLLEDKIVLWACHVNGVLKVQTQDRPAVSEAISCGHHAYSGGGNPGGPVSASSHFGTFDEFHHCVGHRLVVHPERAYRDGHLVPAKPHNFECEDCMLSKSKHTRPVATTSRTTRPLEVVHSDLSGQFSRRSLGGARYYISFIDDATRFAWVKFLEKKSNAAESIIDFVKYLDRQFPEEYRLKQIDITTVIRRFKSDNGGEYLSKKLKDFFTQRGTIHDRTPPYAHELNGVAERFNQTVTQTARSMIPTDKMLKLWAEAINTACFIHNIVPHSADQLRRTPHEMLLGGKPAIKHLHPFGITAYLHVPREARAPGTKLLDRAEKGVFVSYSRDTKTARIYVPGRDAVVESRDVQFQSFGKWKAPSYFQIKPLGGLADYPPKSPQVKPNLRSSEDIRINTPDTPVTPLLIQREPLIHHGDSVSPQFHSPMPMAGGFVTSPENSPPVARRTHSSRQPETPTRNAARNVPRATTRPPRAELPIPTQQMPSPRTTRSGRVIRPTQRARVTRSDDYQACQASGEVGSLAPELENFPTLNAYAYASTIVDDEIPRSYHEAVDKQNVHSKVWISAIAKEMAAHEENGTWKPVYELPQGSKLVGLR